MSLQVTLYQERRSSNANYGKIYGRVKNRKPIGLSELARHMAEHNSVYGEDVILGVMTQMAKCMRELMLVGQPIKLPNIAIMKAAVTSKPANTAQDFDLSKHITCVRLLATATGDLTRAELTKDGTLEYTDLAQKVHDGVLPISALYEDDDDDEGGGDDGGDPDPVRP